MNQLNKQITDAMAKLSISKRELSLRLGKSQNYLGELQRIGCSTEKQAELIAKIQLVIDGHGFKSDKEIIAELSKTAQNRAGQIEVLKRTIDTIDSENDKLRETVRKQDSKIAFLSVTLGQANKNTQYQLERVPVTALAALVLFFKLLFEGKA